MAITREALISATHLGRETITVPDLGQVIVRGMTAHERTLFEKKFVKQERGRSVRNPDHYREWLCIFCCEEPRLTEADLGALSQVNARVLEPIVEAAQRLSGLSEDQADELGKSSPTTTPISSSCSASPEPSTALSA